MPQTVSALSRTSHPNLELLDLNPRRPAAGLCVAMYYVMVMLGKLEYFANLK